MAHLDLELRDRALRAYERGRIFDAALPALAATALVVLSLWFPGSWSSRLGFGGALVALCFWLPYVGGPAGRAVLPGLAAAMFPFGVPLLSHQAACSSGWCGPACMAACIGSGSVAGVILARMVGRSTAAAQQVGAGGTIALLGGSLGCACIGWGGIVGMAAAMLFTLVPIRRLSYAS